MARTLWLETTEVEVTVKDGVVNLRRRLDHRSDVRLVGSMAAHIDGVVGVANRLQDAA